MIEGLWVNLDKVTLDSVFRTGWARVGSGWGIDISRNCDPRGGIYGELERLSVIIWGWFERGVCGWTGAGRLEEGGLEEDLERDLEVEVEVEGSLFWIRSIAVFKLSVEDRWVFACYDLIRLEDLFCWEVESGSKLL